MGSMSRILWPQKHMMPALVTLGQQLQVHGESEEFKVLTPARFLGSAHGPFNIPSPE